MRGDAYKSIVNGQVDLYPGPDLIVDCQFKWKLSRNKRAEYIPAAPPFFHHFFWVLLLVKDQENGDRKTYGAAPSTVSYWSRNAVPDLAHHMRCTVAIVLLLLP